MSKVALPEDELPSGSTARMRRHCMMFASQQPACLQFVASPNTTVQRLVGRDTRGQLLRNQVWIFAGHAKAGQRQSALRELKGTLAGMELRDRAQLMTLRLLLLGRRSRKHPTISERRCLADICAIARIALVRDR